MDKMTRTGMADYGAMRNNRSSGAPAMNKGTSTMSRGNSRTMGCSGSCGGNNSGNNDLMQRIREIDFALYETVLYLDAHPYSTEALAYYHSLLNTRNTLVSEYEAKHGPLTAFGNESHSSWDWVEKPWPWQG